MKGESTCYPIRKREDLTVFMVGNIILKYNRKPLQILGGPLGRILQLVLILLYSEKEGARREELLDMLHGSGECSNPSGSLRTAILRLRKFLEDSELPPRECIRTDGGTCRWDSGELPVYIDARDFGNTAEEVLRTHGRALLERAYGLYQGEFLAQLVGEEWISMVGVCYQELYFSCLRAADSLMKKDREYNDPLEIYNHVCELYPYEKCQIMKIDRLIAMKRSKEVMQVYDAAVSQYFEEQGLPPSEKMLKQFHTMSGQIHYTSDTLKDIRDSLHEKDRTNGLYYYAYPAFINCYRLLARMAERVDFSGVLLCCTLLDARGKSLDTGGELLETTSGKLHGAIAKSLRKDDLFTCYSPSQHLVMPNDTSNEYCLWVYERADRNLHLWDGGRKMKFNYQVMPESLT